MIFSFLKKICYTDFIFTILDYFSVIKKKEFIFEWILPLLAGIGTHFLGRTLCISENFLDSFISTIINVLAILVGFTIAAIAIFTTADLKNHELLSKKSKRKIEGKEITYFRFIYINLIFSSVAGLSALSLAVFLLILKSFFIEEIILSILVFGILFNILLALRNISNLYFSWFKQ